MLIELYNVTMAPNPYKRIHLDTKIYEPQWAQAISKIQCIYTMFLKNNYQLIYVRTIANLHLNSIKTQHTHEKYKKKERLN